MNVKPRQWIRSKYPVLGIRDFIVYEAFDTASGTLDAGLFIFSSLYIILGNGTPWTQLTMITFQMGLMVVGSLFGGRLADRWHPKGAIVIVEGVRCAMLLLLVALSLQHLLNAWWLVGAMGMTGWLEGFATSAITPFLLEITEEKGLYPQGNAVDMWLTQIGVPLGWLLAAWLPGPAFLLADAMTSLLLACGLRLVKSGGTRRPRGDQKVSANPVYTWKYLRKRGGGIPELLILLWSFWFMTIGNFEVPRVVVYLLRGPHLLWLTQGAALCGTTTASFMTARGKEQRRHPLMITGSFLLGIVIVSIFYGSRSWWLSLSCGVSDNFCFSLAEQWAMPMMMLCIEREWRGRVTALITAGGRALMIASSTLCAFFAWEFPGARGVTLGAWAACALTFVSVSIAGGFLSRAQRRARRTLHFKSISAWLNGSLTRAAQWSIASAPRQWGLATSVAS